MCIVVLDDKCPDEDAREDRDDEDSIPFRATLEREQMC